MSPVTHFLTGWVLASTTDFNRRERALVTFACVVPDVDGLGALPEMLTENSLHPLTWYSEYHHMLHNLLFAGVIAVIAFALATRRWKTAGCAFLAFHIHLLQDVAGSKSASGDHWPIPYLIPFSRWWWTWSGQWLLNSWPNMLITLLLLAAVLWLAWKRGYSPLEIISKRADGTFVATLRQRWSRPTPAR